MDEDAFNIEVRKFLKKLGVTAQREIEAQVRSALADGRLAVGARVPARAVITLEGVGEIVVEGDIALS